MYTRDERFSSFTVIALASPLLGALALGCAPAAAPGPSVEGAALAAPEAVAVSVSADADVVCEPVKFHDARFGVTTARHYEDANIFDPDSPSCDITTRDETSSERYHLFWKDNDYFLAPLGQEETKAIRLSTGSTATEFTFSAEFSKYYEDVFNICPEYRQEPYWYFNGIVTGTLAGRIDRATGAISFTRQCRAEAYDISCDGFELALDVTSQGAHLCEPSNADPLPVACAPLASDDLGAARMHVIGTRLTADDGPSADCAEVYSYIDYDATFTLRQEGGQYFANLFEPGQQNAIALTKIAETATEVVFGASAEGPYIDRELRNLCPEYRHFIGGGAWMAGELEVRVNLSTGAIKEERNCFINYPACGSDQAFSEHGKGAYVCPP